MLIRALGILVLFVSASASAATRIPVVIDEPFPRRTVAWPVTTGIPFPRGQLTAERHCRLVDQTGREQVLQSRVAATWDAERTSIRWLTIDFVAQPDCYYTLEFGADIQRKSFPNLVSDRQERSIRVATGKIFAEFHSPAQQTATALRGVAVDFNANGTLEAAEMVLHPTTSGEHLYVDQYSRRFSSERDGADRRVVVECKGPVRACVRVDGFYTGPDRQRIVEYRTRYHFFAGLGLIKVVDEFRIVGSTRGTEFQDIQLSWRLNGEPTRVVVDASGDVGSQTVAVDWSEETTGVVSFQSEYRHFGNPACRGGLVEATAAGERTHHETERVGEWMQVISDRAAVTGSLRGMWQQFPKEWEVQRDQLTLHLWSPRGGNLDFGADGLREFFGEAGKKYILQWEGVRGTMTPISQFFYFAGHGALERGEVDGKGIRKHHEFYLHVAPAAEWAAGQEYGQLAAQPPLALASGEWNCSTEVFGPLAARPSESPYEAIVDRLFDLGREAQDSFGDYGWWAYGSGPHYSYQWDAERRRHYADPRRFEYHTYQKETQLWWNYLRSGERKFYDWALPSENHWVDIAVTHVPVRYHCDWRGGFEHSQTLHFRPGDWSIDSAMFYVRHRDSAEAWLRGGSQFWASYHRTLETTTLAYYLTGDERFHDVLNYWREYWQDLAGVHSASRDVQPWHREQPWFVATGPGEPRKTWAEMIRDYSPFTSGLRHQMTQFYNLATLYEHSWDPKIGQVLRECADVYLDPEHPIGVWRTQENRPPNHAAAPRLCHYWVPALWKYARASGDPRMPEIFRRYFDACYAADPFRENIGQYSQVHLGYAYYYTRDPRHLRPAKLELDALLPESQPLRRPEDLGRRLYNPYAPIRAFTAVPRLTWALDAAASDGVEMRPSPPLRPQRAVIALQKQAAKPLTAKLWGYDPAVVVIGPDGRPCDDARFLTKQYASDIQPFDRHLPKFSVYLHELYISEQAPEGFYLLVPKLELAVLEAGGNEDHVLVNASVPVAIDPGKSCRIRVTDGMGLEVLTAAPQALHLFRADGSPLDVTRQTNIVTADVSEFGADETIELRNQGRSVLWFQTVDCPEAKSWVTFSSELPQSPPTSVPTLRDKRGTGASSPDTRFVQGRFGQALQMIGGREFRIPDHVTVDGKKVELFDRRQGTIEFWVKRQWDERVQPVRPVTFLSNGPLQAWSPWKLPLREWAHVAVEWRPLARDPQRQAVHIYVNGHDAQNYRSTWWEGYSQKPQVFRKDRPWLQAFVCSTTETTPFLIDELRVSSVPRYSKLDVVLGGQQTFNPANFQPPQEPLPIDKHTLLLLHFDEDLTASSAISAEPLQGRISDD